MTKETTSEGLKPYGLGAIALSFALGIFFYGGNSGMFLLLAVLLLFLVTVSHCIHSINNGKVNWSKLHSLIALWSLFLLSNIYTSLFSENSILMVCLFLSMPMVLLLSEDLQESNWHKILFYLSIPMLLSACWGISEFIVTGKRANGPVIDPNSWASVFNIFYFLLLTIFFKANKRESILVLSLLCIISTALFTAYSRVGNLNFFLAVIFISALALLIKQLRLKVYVLLATVCLSFITTNLITNSSAATNNDEGYTLDVETKGWSQRFSQWKSGIDQYKDHKVLGSGLGTFRLLYPQYRSEGDLYTAGNFLHNDYIQLLAETGPLGLLFVFALLFFLVCLLWKAITAYFMRRNVDALAYLESIILIVAIGTIFVHAIMNFTLYNLPNQILIGLVLARLLQLNKFNYTLEYKFSSPKLASIGVVILSSYLVVVNTLDFISFDLVYKGGHIRLDQSEADAEVTLYNTVSKIAQLRPNVSGNRFAMATFFRTSFDQQDPSNIDARQSLAFVTALEYQRGLEINPYTYQIRLFFSDFLRANPELMSRPEIYQSPELLLRGGLALAPCYPERYVYLAGYLNETGRSEEAYQMLLKQALPWANMHYDGYKDARTNMFKQIYRGALARSDKAGLEKLLAMM